METVVVGEESEEENVAEGESSQQLFEGEEDDDDDKVQDADYIPQRVEGSSDTEEEEDAAIGLTRRISIAGIGRSSNSRGAPQPAASTTRTTEPPTPIPAVPAAAPAAAAASHSGRKGVFTSPIWQFFTLSAADSKFAFCNVCKQKLSRGCDPAKYGTSCLLTHLAKKHVAEHQEFKRLKEAGAGSGQPSAGAPSRPHAPPAAAAAAPTGVRKRTAPPSATPANTEELSGSQSSVASSALSSASHATSRRRRQTLLSESFPGVVKALPPGHTRIRKLNGWLARAMCSQLLPYSLVEEGSDMRALLQCAAPDWPIPSRHYFSRTAIPALHQAVMANVGRSLDHAVGERVHITMDSWSSRFGTDRYLSFTAHWVSLVEGGEAASGTAAAQWVEPPRGVRGNAAASSGPVSSSGTPAKRPLLSSSVKARHCQALLEMVSLGKSKLTADHVLAKLREQERSWLSDRGLRVGEVVSDNGANLVAAIHRGNLTHIPCLAHVLNLVVQKFLRTYQGMDDLLQLARRTVTYFRRSPAASASLRALQGEHGLPRRRLIIDVATRWNSTLAMLERLVEQRRPVTFHLLAAHAEGKERNVPSVMPSADWAAMQKVCLLLAPFLQATNMVSGNQALVCEWVPLVCLLDRALFSLLEEGETALTQLDQQAAAESTSQEEEEEEDLQLVEEEELEVPDLDGSQGDRQSAAAVVRGWREDEAQRAREEDSSTVVSVGDDDDNDVSAVASLFPMAAHMLRCLRRDPRVIQMRAREDIWISMMLDPRLKGKLGQFLPAAGGDPERQMRELQAALVRRLEEAFPQLYTPPVTVQPAQQRVPPTSSSSSRRTTDLLSLTRALYTPLQPPREEVPASSSAGRNQRLTRMVADYMGSFGGLDTEAPVDPLEYWVKRLDIWSELAQYALQVLSCPPSSVMSERCFSAAGGVVTEKRSRLSTQSVDRLTFLKINQAWFEGEFLAPVVGKRGT